MAFHPDTYLMTLAIWEGSGDLEVRGLVMAQRGIGT